MRPAELKPLSLIFWLFALAAVLQAGAALYLAFWSPLTIWQVQLPVLAAVIGSTLCAGIAVLFEGGK